MKKSIKYIILLFLYIGINDTFGQRYKKPKNLLQYDSKKLHFGLKNHLKMILNEKTIWEIYVFKFFF